MIPPTRFLGGISQKMTARPMPLATRYLVRIPRLSRNLNAFQLGFRSRSAFELAMQQVDLQFRLGDLPESHEPKSGLDKWQAGATEAVLCVMGIDSNDPEAIAVAQLVDAILRGIETP